MREFDAFCQSEYPRLVGILGLYCGDRAVAEELAQEALARAWQRWRRVAAYDNPSAWVARVGLNLATSHHRRRQAEGRARARIGRTAEATASHAGDVELRDALSRVSKKKRAALILRFYLDLPFAEIGRVMDVPESTAKSLARRGVEDLRAALSPGSLKEVPDVT